MRCRLVGTRRQDLVLGALVPTLPDLMLRARAILVLLTLLALLFVRPMHWGVHAMGGHAACHDDRAQLAAETAHEGCDHHHGDADSPTPNHSDHGSPADRDDVADCELCLAIALLATGVVAAPLHVPHAVPTAEPIPASVALPRAHADHAPLHARPPPARTI